MKKMTYKSNISVPDHTSSAEYRACYEELQDYKRVHGKWLKESDAIGELTKDFATLQQKAQENEARWQAVCADLEAKLEVAVEALSKYCHEPFSSAFGARTIGDVCVQCGGNCFDPSKVLAKLKGTKGDE